MTGRAREPSGALARLLRQRRGDLGLSLQQAALRMRRLGEDVSRGTLQRIETGQLDVSSSRRLFRLLRMYDVPPSLAAELVEIDPADLDQVPSGTPEEIYQAGREHWKSGNTSGFLACVQVVMQSSRPGEPTRSKALIALATIARNLGRTRLASELLQQYFCDERTEDHLVNALVLAASVWRQLGAPEMALAFCDRAARLVGQDGEEFTWILHVRAQIALEAGRIDEADNLVADVVKRYEAAGATQSLAKALLIQCRIHEFRDAGGLATDAAERAMALCRYHDHSDVLANAHLALGRTLFNVDRLPDAVSSLKQGAGLAEHNGEALVEGFCRYYLWRCYSRLGDSEGAAAAKQAAQFVLSGTSSRVHEVVDALRHLEEDTP
jgi:tetratricopeptide (TPR) repeat protein